MAHDHVCGARTRLAMLRKIFAVLDHTAETAARLAHCTVKRHWVSKSKPGLANHAMAEITYRNLETRRAAASSVPTRSPSRRRLQAELGLEPMAEPFADELSKLITPQEAEAPHSPRNPGLADALYVRRLHRHDLARADGALLCRPRQPESAGRFRLSRMGDECAGRHSGDHRSDGRLRRQDDCRHHPRSHERSRGAWPRRSANSPSGSSAKPIASPGATIRRRSISRGPIMSRRRRGRQWWIPATAADRALERG